MSGENRRDSTRDLLLVVDFQNVYLPGEEWACPAMPDAMRNTLRILSSPNAPDVLLTKFIAPEHPVGRWRVYNSEYRAINESDYLCALAKPFDKLAAQYPVAEKSTYSSMKGAVVAKALEGKTAVVLAGVVAECCVLSTMMEAIDMGYEVIYLYDCVAGQTKEMEDYTRKLAEMFSTTHTQVMSSGEYLAMIQSTERG